jgi:tripartite-type tricarboxylate transporter receptor subunit TctC
MKGTRGSASRPVVVALLVGFLVLGISGIATAQDYPAKSISVVVGMEAGGVVDVASRVLSEEAKKVLGKDILIENKPGASHMIAGSYVVNSKPDGYIIWGATDAPFLRVPHMFKLKFDPIKETTPIIFYGIFTHFVVVPAESPFKTLKDMLVFAKDNPMKLTFGNPGVGTVPHLTMAGMDLETGLKISHIPFKGEPAEIAALLGGHLMAAGIAIDSCIAQVKAGKLRAIGVLQGDHRLSAFPEIPTLKEVAKDFGMKSSVIYPGLMMVGPKGLPEPIVKKLADAFEIARKTPAFQKYASEQFIFQDNMPLTGQALQDHLTNGFRATGELIEKLKIPKN